MEGFESHVGADSDAGAALLMLDIASAKSTLEQLKQTCEGAAKRHAETKTELLSLQQQHLNIQGATYALDSFKSPLCSRSAAQQLQALHTENLQLKACLKQEVEARQQLERKHRELLDLLRSGQVLQLLASGHINNATPSEQPYQAGQQQWPSTADVYNRIAADAAHCSDQAALAGGQATVSDGSNSAKTGLQQPGCTASTSSYTSSAADGDSWQHDSSTAAAPTGGLDEVQARAGAAAHSAYFPAQATLGSHMQHQPKPSLQVQQQPQHGSMLAGTVPGLSSKQHNSVGGPAAKGLTPAAVPTLSSPSAGAPATWQESLQQGLFVKLAQQGNGQGRPGLQSWPGQQRQQQQQNASIGTNRTEQAGAGAAIEQHHSQQHQQETFQHAAVGQVSQQAGFGDVSTGFEVDEGLLSTSSSSHSAHSELLDSDDLDELAGLCDSLLHRHEGQSIDSTAAALQDAYSTLQQERQQHIQQELAGTTWDDSPAPSAAQQHSEQDYRQVSVPGIPQHAASQACVPGLQALAAQLRQLQEQVSATAMDAAPARGTSSSVGSLRGARSSSTPNQQPPAWGSSSGASSAHAGVDQQSYAAGAQCRSAQQHSSRAGQRRGSTGSSSGLWPPGHAQHEVDEGPATTNLQQQLAQRMQEVKERLSNICNGMLQDGAPFEVPDPGSGVPVSSSWVAPSNSGVPASSSFWSPSTSPPVRPQPSSTSKASAGSARVAAAVAGPSTSSTGKATKTAARTPAAGKGGSPVVHKPGTVAGSVHSFYSNFAKRAASAKTAAASSKSGPAGARSGPAGAAGKAQPQPDPADDAAAAFAAIKASIDSAASVPGFFNISSTAPAAPGRPRVGGQSAAAADCASVHDSSGPPAAACQGSWASASDAVVTDDSEGSWATVDDSEQEQLQQQLHQQGLREAQQAMNERHRQQKRPLVSSSPGYSRRNAGHSSSPGLGDRTGAQAGSHPVPGWHHQHADQENHFPRSEACFPSAAHLSPQRAAQDCEQPASPISCESSRLSAAARMPAEVVFSPMKGN